MKDENQTWEEFEVSQKKEWKRWRYTRDHLFQEIFDKIWIAHLKTSGTIVTTDEKDC